MVKTYYATVPLVGSVRVSWTGPPMSEEAATAKAVLLAGETGFRVELVAIDPPDDAPPDFHLEPGDEFDCSIRHHNRGNVCQMPVAEAQLDYSEELDDETVWEAAGDQG